MLFRSKPELVYWPKVEIGERGLGFKFVNIPKRHICQGRLNQTLFIMPYTRWTEQAESICQKFNGHILRRSQLDDVTPFFEENQRVWIKNCSNTVWTDTDNQTQFDGLCEFYDAQKATFNKTSCHEDKCFICVWEQKRSLFQIHLPVKSYSAQHEEQKNVSFTLKNDDSGGLVFVGNDGDYIIQGSPLKCYVLRGLTWKVIAQQPDEWLLPGVNNFTRVNDSGMTTSTQLETKISNVRFSNVLTHQRKEKFYLFIFEIFFSSEALIGNYKKIFLLKTLKYSLP